MAKSNEQRIAYLEKLIKHNADEKVKDESVRLVKEMAETKIEGCNFAPSIQIYFDRAAKIIEEGEPFASARAMLSGNQPATAAPRFTLS